MKKVLIFMVLIALFVSNGMAQNYQIQDLLADSLTTWQVYGNGQVGGSHRNEDIKDEKDFYSTNYSISPIVRFKFKRIRQNSDLSINAYSLFDYNERKNSIKTSEDSWSWDIKESINLNYDYYFWDKIGLSINSGMGFLYGKTEESKLVINEEPIDEGQLIYERDGTIKRQQDALNFRIEPGVVFGRIYDGQYAAKAAEMVDALQAEGLLTRALTQAEFQQLSRIILERKAAYHYDSRIKKLEALNNIMDYLKSIGIVEANNHQAAFILQDLYAYGLIGEEDERKFGLKFYGNILYTNNQNETNTDEIYDVTVNKLDYSDGSLVEEESYVLENNHETSRDNTSYGIRFGLHHAVIRNWNFYFNYGLNYQYSVHEDEQDQNNYAFDKEIKRHQVNLNGTIFYKFNSRSIAKLQSDISYSKYNYKNDSWFNDYNGNGSTTSLSLVPQFIYYITPKFYLSTDVDLHLSKYQYEYEIIPDNGESETDINESLETATTASISLGYYL